MFKPRLTMNERRQLISSHHAATGSSTTRKPISKPTACSTRRLKLRPRVRLFASQRSNMALYAKFQLIAKSEAKTANAPARSRLLSLKLKKPRVPNKNAIASQVATQVILRLMPCRVILKDVGSFAIGQDWLYLSSIRLSFSQFNAFMLSDHFKCRLKQSSGRTRDRAKIGMQVCVLC